VNVHVTDEEGNDLKTWAFYCESKRLPNI
jgi:hypothetical protein